MNRVFFIAGRTGGPFFPLPAVAKNLTNIEAICIGIRGGFEQAAATKRGWKIHYLPDTRLTLLSFKTEKPRETIKNYLDLVKNLFFLVWSLVRSLYLLVLYRPRMIYSTGSFLAVPVIYCARLTNLLKLTNSKIVIHQQDPLPGLSNKLTVAQADLVSCTFDYTKSNFSKFKDATLIPNPIDTDLYDHLDSLDQITNPELKIYLETKSDLPLMLIFGGGGGSEDINVWTLKNITELLKHFRIIHLTGILQKKELESIDHTGYLRLPALFSEMPVVIKTSDVVLCRAGMASITELLYLQKPAYLVPLPSTHQEKNAEMVQDYFYILHQKDRPTWAATIFETYPKYFTAVSFPRQDQTKIELQKYYQKLQSLLDN